MADEAQKGVALNRLLQVWSRRKWLAVVVFVLPLAAVLAVLAVLPNIYRSAATVLVDRQQVPEAFVKSTVTSELETRLQTISQEVLSRSRLDDLIRRFGLYPTLRGKQSTEQLVERMRSDIRLELKTVDQRGDRRATVAFTISYAGGDPQTVAQVTNTLASFYIEENLKARERQAAGTSEFLRVQLEETQKRLEEQERRLSEFKRRYMGELPDQTKANLSTIEQINAQLQLNSTNQQKALERRDLLAKQLAEAEGAILGSSSGGVAATGGPEATATRLAKLRQDLMEMRTRYTEKYPEVVRLKQEIATLEQSLREEQSAPKTPQPKEPERAVVTPQMARLRESIREIDAELRVLRSEERRLRGLLPVYQSRVENAPRREQEMQELERGYHTIREQYQSLLKRREEAQLAESMEQRQKGEQFRILDPALPGTQPTAPNRPRLLLVGLGLAGGLALGAVLLAEQLDTSFHSLDELRAFTPVAVLASIPRIVTEGDRRHRKIRFVLATAGTALALVLVVGACILLARGNESLVLTLSHGRV